ncbi:hypothetical protein OC842_001509 [Tilletia horrida]|uniref:Uncharacterized protein n=1 Tax=Tilletia horrida TaxID=155126 RepID=A0AAN6GHQ4_9BASI|nr:hypothetical protein OC842_001509 [Tilletia horrida]
MQTKQDAAEAWGTTFRRRANKQTKGRYRNETFVVRSGFELAPKCRSELIETTPLALFEEAFIIQQDILEPLTDDELRLLFQGSQDVDVRNVGPQDPDHTPLPTEKWQWCELLTIVQQDSPSTSDLRSSSPPSTELFWRASCFPGLPVHSLSQDEKEYVDGAVPHPPSKLSGISSWISGDVPQRDAKEKCYITVRCQDMEDGSTNFPHVDEAGAMNTLLWVRQQPKALRRTKPAQTSSGLLRLPPHPAHINQSPVTEDELDGRPVGIQWLWWPPHARQHFERAAADA